MQTTIFPHAKLAKMLEFLAANNEDGKPKLVVVGGGEGRECPKVGKKKKVNFTNTKV